MPCNYNLSPYQEKCMCHAGKSLDSHRTHPAHLMSVFLWSHQWIELKSTCSVACLLIGQLNNSLRGRICISRTLLYLLVKRKYSKYNRLKYHSYCLHENRAGFGHGLSKYLATLCIPEFSIGVSPIFNISINSLNSLKTSCI